MKANELRIGNLVTINNPEHWKEMKDIPVYVTGITQRNDYEFPKSTGIIDMLCKKDPKGYFKRINQFDEFIQPIELTEEWLLKFGFEKLPTKDYFTLYLSDKDESEIGRQRIDYWFGEDDFSAAELCRSGVCFKRVKIKYVHQLQNLIYLLTGQEITL